MNSGYGKYYGAGDRIKYFGYPPGVYESNPRDTEHLHFPGIHPETATWLARNREGAGRGTLLPAT